jgi:DNA-binding NarL/FixJ family response regulator
MASNQQVGTSSLSERASFVLKTMPPQDLVETIHQVHAGRKRVTAEVAADVAEHLTDEGLTEREIDVLLHIAGGNRNRDIAKRLLISEETVKVHIRHIMEKSVSINDCMIAFQSTVKFGSVGETVKETMSFPHMQWT